MNDDDDRKERLALWLDDALRLSPELRRGLLGGRLDLTKIIRVGRGELQRHKSVPAVEFECPLVEAALVCDLIRNHDRRIGQRETEMYIHRGTSWSRICYGQVLTVSVGGSTRLNPAVFPTAAAAVDTTVEARPVR